MEHSSVLCWNLDTLENRPEIAGKFWNVVMEKDGGDQLDQLCEKLISITQNEGGKEYPLYNKTKEG